jgi:hypothetical protein
MKVTKEKNIKNGIKATIRVTFCFNELEQERKLRAGRRMNKAFNLLRTFILAG